jgi:hypothetical protein
MKKNNKVNILLTSIFLVIQCLTFVGYINRHVYKHLMGLIVFTLVFLAYTYIKVKFNIYMRPYITIFVILTVLGTNLGGDYFGLYTKSVTYDKLLHIIGTYAFSLFFYTIISQFFPTTSLNIWREFVFIILIGAAFGMAFELMEFFSDVVFRPVIPNQSDLLDTDLDMINDLVGAVLAAIHLYVSKFRIVEDR